jgi:hypothetical protein
MNTRTVNRIDQLNAAMPPDCDDIPVPEIPAGFTGTLFYNRHVTAWFPDNGRGPADEPRPNIVRIPD